jgi:amino acid transporter
MEALVPIGLALYYAAVAAGLSWWLKRNSPWFTGFLAVVLCQVVLFGGDYLYYGSWDAWNDIALITTSALCILIVIVVVCLFNVRRKAPNAPT